MTDTKVSACKKPRGEPLGANAAEIAARPGDSSLKRHSGRITGKPEVIRANTIRVITSGWPTIHSLRRTSLKLSRVDEPIGRDAADAAHFRTKWGVLSGAAIPTCTIADSGI